ncbi:hypothetical protein Q73_01125 [Bacillus coahuilensis m2-6]|uniref:Gas vesicle protein n=1 Tax=Bacillus coahuilensis p1.1.43 TaxID=1150625 RepID=A0A147KBX3_9BACI|nr:YtxH domain-containing protein [Bacillus coahuilensis]KUP09021.1 hypothetical protein Q75_01580 [Bacillus coahuilensis p1.1.43]KUP09865.1 hypothetical protein Q73_01125 [Bacillus coahuilensis m2-6]
MAKNKLVQGLIYGAAIGALVSLADKNTRKNVVNTSRKGSEQVKYYSKNPQDLGDYMKELYEKVKVATEQLNDDFKFINEKFEKVRNDIAPEVKEVLDETQETLMDSKNNYKEVLSENQLDKESKEESKGMTTASSVQNNRTGMNSTGNVKYNENNIRTYQEQN